MADYLVTGNTDLTAAGKGKRLCAWHFANTGAAAEINLRSGSVSGPIKAKILLAAGTSASQAYDNPETRLVFEDGLFVQVVSGTIVGSVTTNG